MELLAIAHAVPSQRVRTEDTIAEVIRASSHLSGADLKWLESELRRLYEKAGTSIRYHPAADEGAQTFAVDAARRALARGDTAPDEVDLVMFAGIAKGWLEPATSNLFLDELGLKNATGFDVMDACASWIRALEIARALLEGGRYRRILVINCEFLAREFGQDYRLDRSNVYARFPSLTIGDAATATLLGPAREQKELFLSFRSHASGHPFCKIPLPNYRDFEPAEGVADLEPMKIAVRPADLLLFTFRMGVEHFRATPELTGPYDLIVGHNASVHSTTLFVSGLKLEAAKFFDTHARFGNTGAASLPLALSVAEEEGRLRRGHRVLLLMGSAGVTTAFGSLIY